MKKFLSNLSPFERRLFIGTAVVVFIVLNWWLVWPHFSDWSQVRARLQKATDTLAMFNAEIAKQSEYERQISLLEKAGAPIEPVEQASDFMRNIESQAALSHVALLSTTPQQNAVTNQFFLEKVMAITLQSGESNIVDFIYNVGAGSSMIRVRDLSLRPDSSHQQLAGTIRLVASYQKTTSGRTGPTAGKSPLASSPPNNPANPNATRP